MIELLQEIPAPESTAPPFAWPAEAWACRAEVETIGGAIAAVRRAGCAESLVPALDALVGVRFPGVGDACFSVVLAPEEGQGTVRFAPSVLSARRWPAEWGRASRVPLGTTCRVSLAWSPGAPARVEWPDGCPLGRFAEEVGAIVWQTSAERAPPGEVVHADVVFAWVADPRDPDRGVLLPERHPFPRVRVQPAWPSGADAPGRERCVASVAIDAAGAVEVRSVGGCEEPFAASARAALEQWWFWPHVVGGAPVPVVVPIGVAFERRP